MEPPDVLSASEPFPTTFNECVCKDLKAAAIHYSVRTGRGDKEPDFRDYHACLKAKRSFLWHDRTKP